MSILGPLAGEPPEPMTREQIDAARKRIRTSRNGSVTYTKADAERLIAEIAWLKKRLHRVEHAIEPLQQGLLDEESKARRQAVGCRPTTSAIPPADVHYLAHMKKLFVFGAMLVIAAVTPFVLVHRVHVAERAWAADFGSLESYPRRWNAEMNQTADDLSEQAAPLGIAVAFTEKRILIHPINAEVLTQVLQYASDAELAPTDTIKPSAAVSDYVRQRDKALDTFCDWVAKNPPPVVPVRLVDAGEPVPNHLYLLRLQKLLVAAALSRYASGQRAEAERLLDASWRLNQELRRSPTLIAQLIASATLRLQLGAIRKMDFDSRKWIARLHEHDYRESFIAALQGEAFIVDASVRDNVYADSKYIASMQAFSAALDAPPGFRPAWYVWLRTPIRWFDLPSALEAEREMLLAARTARTSEHIEGELEAAFARGAGRWWSVADRDVTRAFNGVQFKRLARTNIESELTEKVLLARAARKANGGRWPMEIPEFEKSAVENRKWIYTASRDGASLRIEPPIEFTDLVGDSAPLHYELR